MEEKYYKISAIVVIAALILGAVMVVLPYPPFSGAPAEGTEFTIDKGETLGAVAHSLADQNLIMSRYLFVAYAIFTGQERKFQAGGYTIPPRVSVRKLVSVFAEGKGVSEDITVTVPEGTNIADAGKILETAGLVGKEEFLRKAISLEGFLFPDTYRFKRSEAGENLLAEEIIREMKNNFEIRTRDIFTGHFTGEGGAERGYGVIIVASILEKEVKTERDMRLVAGIIEKRLAKNMPLELDATVTYGVCEPKFLAGQYCDVSLAKIIDNLKVSTPYNTYANKGLPIGPISNPGLAAIEATLNPEKSDYLYYLSAPDGTTIFSRTAAEHERARRKYLK